MATIFTNAGEFRRGKGNRKGRLGPRVQIETVARETGGKQAVTPDEIALKKLLRLLDKPGLSKKDRYSYVDLMRRAEQIRFMNMGVLAEVLLYMHNVGNIVTETNFSYQAILPYIDRLLPKKEINEAGTGKEIAEEDLQIMRLRMAATFLRYIRYVSFLRQQAEEELQAAQEREQTLETAPILGEF